jgi:hypothetical protein
VHDMFLVVWQVLHACCRHVSGSAACIVYLLFDIFRVARQVLQTYCLHLNTSTGHV